MNDGMTAVLAELPPRLGDRAGRLWRHCRQTTEDVTETLRVSFRLLGQVCGDPAALTVAGDLLSREVAAEIGRARDEIDAAYPAAARSWQGSGAESFRGHLPRLSATLRSVAEGANHTAAAVARFRDGVDSVCTTVVDRTERTDAEVTAAQAATRQTPHETIGAVIDIVEEYATYVEELATTLLDLTSDGHAAGRELALAAALPHGVTAEGGTLRLPRFDTDLTELRPAHAQITLDTAAMAGLTASLSDNGTRLGAASGSALRAAEHLTPDAFGLAGSHFCDDVHAVLDRDRELYATVNRRTDELALGLRRVSAAFLTADDEAAAELRRGLDDR